MQTAKKSDKEWIVKLLTEVYHDNPTVLYAANYKKENIPKVFAFSFDEFLKVKGVFYHSSKMGVLFMNPGVKRPKSSPFKQLKFLLTVSGIRKGIKLKERRATLLKEHPKCAFIHIGVFGIAPHPKRLKTALEIKNFVFNMAKEKQMDVYLETTLEKTKRVYSYYGFECYKQFDLSEAKHMWYLMRLKFQDIPNIRQVFD